MSFEDPLEFGNYASLLEIRAPYLSFLLGLRRLILGWYYRLQLWTPRHRRPLHFVRHNVVHTWLPALIAPEVSAKSDLSHRFSLLSQDRSTNS